MKGKETLEKYLFLNSEASGRRHAVYRMFCVVCNSEATAWRARAASGRGGRLFSPSAPRPSPGLELACRAQRGPWSAACHFMGLKTSGDPAPSLRGQQLSKGRACAGRLLGGGDGGQCALPCGRPDSGLPLPGSRSHRLMTRWNWFLSQGS